ncbi:MAG: hypothetical protein NTX53_04100 [candidate division WOR-3 bacterium]|nr:hypothetical protein [candidate division WOR-3 bacterium]
MRSFVVISVVAAAFATANPVAITFINEFGFDDDSLGWVELHAEPLEDAVGMTGWLLMTSTSACTFAYTMPYDGFLVVDSLSLAGGEYGHGTFRLDPAGDSIWVVPDWNHLEYSDEVEFPVLPADWGRAPMPSDHGSASLMNADEGRNQTINWYIDSTPTLGQDNDDYSTVIGTVTWPPNGIWYVDVSVTGPMGSSYSTVGGSGYSYLAIGLSAGRYEVVASASNGEVLVYPESLDLGYNQTLRGIDFGFTVPGMAEGLQPTVPGSAPAASVLHGLPPGAVAYDPSGRRVTNLKSGIYFVRAEPSAASRQPSAVTVRKVILQR